jgi:carbamoyl-phosphate synthase large subunit
MMKAHRVIITGIGGNIGQGILKSLRSGKRRYEIIGLDMEPLSAGFAFTDRHYVVPRTEESGFNKALTEILAQEIPEAIFVCSPTELDYFSSKRDDIKIQWGCTTLVNPPEVVRIGSDKLLTTNFLKSHNLPWLPTALAENRDDVELVIRETGFPVIIKPRKGFSSHNVFLIDSFEKLKAFSELIPDLIVQKYIPGDVEYTAGTISDVRGRVRASIILRRHLIQGTTYRTELVQEEILTTQVIRIVESLKAIGPCNLQFRAERGKALVFEINPRFSGTSGIRYLYGFNDPELVFELLHLGLEIAQPALQEAVVLRYWNEVVLPNASFSTLSKGEVDWQRAKVVKVQFDQQSR